jgi:hypothetical protein
LALAITLGTPAIAKKKKIETPTEKKAPIIHGLFNVQHQKRQLDIPDTRLITRATLSSYNKVRQHPGKLREIWRRIGK